MIIGLEGEARIDMTDLIDELRQRGCVVTFEHAGGGVEIVRAMKDDANCTAGPFLDGYAFNDTIHYGDDRINEVGDWWGNEEGTASDLADEMMGYLK